MAANGISTLPTKEARQLAKLNLAQTKRQSAGTPHRTLQYLDITELPTVYSGNTVVNNPNVGGLVIGRPWKTTPNILAGLWRSTYAGYYDNDPTWFDAHTPIESTAVDNFDLYDGDIFSSQWLGYFQAPHTATYTFYRSSDDASGMWLGENAITGYTDSNQFEGTIALTEGQLVPIRLQYGNAGGNKSLNFSWSDDYTPPVPPPTGNDFFFAGDQNNWIIDGGVNLGSVFSDPAPTNPAYTYPDNSYTGKTYNFDGTSYMISMNLAIGGAWQSNTITIDFWFLPTANGVQLLTELGQQNFTQPGFAGYHTTLLEINSDGNIKARFWQNVAPGQVITSTNTVDLNHWNHIYFTEDELGNHSFELNGIPTTSNPSYTRLTPLTLNFTNIHYAVGGYDFTNMGNTSGFQGKIGYLNIHDYPVGSTWTNTNARFRP